MDNFPMEEDQVDSVLSQILPHQIFIKAESAEEGHPAENLLLPFSKGWKSTSVGKTWIQIEFTSPKKIRIVGMRSNGDNENSDPAEIEIIGKSEGEWFYFSKVKNLEFGARNVWKNVNLLFYGKQIEVIKIIFLKNAASLKGESQPTQFNELVFFE